SAAKTGADRLHTVPNVENTRAGLKHKRTEEKEVVAADQNDLSIGTISKQPFEVPCCCQAADAASENDNASGYGSGHHHDVRRSHQRFFIADPGGSAGPSLAFGLHAV